MAITSFFKPSTNALWNLTLPLIVFKRDSVEKDRSLANKLDGNKVHNYQVVGSKYNKRNAYDKFDLINNILFMFTTYYYYYLRTRAEQYFFLKQKL